MECTGCEKEDCQVCCPHDDMEHYMCSACGYETDPGDEIDWIYEQMREY